MAAKTSIPTVSRQDGLRAVFLVNMLLVLTFIVIPQIVTAAQAGLGDEELARLKRGEILLETIHAEKSGAAARVTALLHSSVNDVWNILGYCKYELVYVKGLKHCEVLEGDQFQMMVRHRVRNSWYSPTMDFVFAASRDLTGAGKATLVSGDLKVFEGQWKLYPLTDENSVIIVHEIRVQSRFPAPKWLIRRALRNDLPDMLACIRGLASASGTDRHIQRDLKRCPGDVSQLLK
jgi:hypothetical protein